MRELSKRLQDYLIDFINLPNGEIFIVRDECNTLKRLKLILLALGQEVQLNNCEELICRKKI
ncbi:hypothetical protein [Saccharolobus islandicus]|uniref:hypothetical protein n=1 Tax=Saccharolobus islandicus TaxID=43080 RepID=UPI00057FDDEF|nr:hypothetical protein [Sulfolobus islandicus]